MQYRVESIEFCVGKIITYRVESIRNIFTNLLETILTLKSRNGFALLRTTPPPHQQLAYGSKPMDILAKAHLIHGTTTAADYTDVVDDHHRRRRGPNFVGMKKKAL
jgi:hypothetical protein